MFRTLLSIVALSAFALAQPCPAGAAQAPPPARQTAKGETAPIVNLNTASVKDLDAAAGHRREDRGADRRVPAEERAVQEDRGADERAGHRREELSEAEAAAHGGAGQSRSSN